MQQQLEWGRFWKLLEFSERVDKLLEVRGAWLGNPLSTLCPTFCTASSYCEVVGPGEVCFQPGCSAAEVRALVPNVMKDVRNTRSGAGSALLVEIQIKG